MSLEAVESFGSADEYVGAQVNQLMFLRRMKRKELGLLIQVDGQTAGRKLRGERSWSLDELLVIARYFDVPLEELLPGNDYDPVLTGRGRVSRACRDSNPKPSDLYPQPALRLIRGLRDDDEPTPDGAPIGVCPRCGGTVQHNRGHVGPPGFRYLEAVSR